MKKILIALGMISFAAGFGIAFAQDTPLAIRSAAPACLTLTGNLRVGMQSSAGVAALQDFLSVEGYFSAASSGNFGPVTFQAVKDYQAEAGISATGYVGPLTRAAIRAASCGNANAKPLSAAAAASTTAQTLAAPTLRIIDPGQAGIGDAVKLTGTAFTAKTYVLINGANAAGPIISPDGTSISFQVPSLLGSACDVFSPGSFCPQGTSSLAPGTYLIQVETENGLSSVGKIAILAQSANPNNAATFDSGSSSLAPASVSGAKPVAAKPAIPVIFSISPQSGPRGTAVTISGSGFASSGNVIYLGSSAITPASGIASADGTSLSFLVPTSSGVCPRNALCSFKFSSLAPGNYPVSAANANGASNSLSFSLAAGVAGTSSDQ